jgi:hypothetical protein
VQNLKSDKNADDGDVDHKEKLMATMKDKALKGKET